MRERYRLNPPDAEENQATPTEAEVVRISVERTADMEAFWRLMKRTRRTLKPGSVKIP
ncbi:MAG: hypothetical protein HYV92_10215 [Candidatus Rokubacteria bacterium]|nr:hypothetical protein [Candidatus Rokubacteria bacterium]